MFLLFHSLLALYFRACQVIAVCPTTNKRIWMNEWHRDKNFFWISFFLWPDERWMTADHSLIKKLLTICCSCMACQNWANSRVDVGRQQSSTTQYTVDARNSIRDSGAWCRLYRLHLYCIISVCIFLQCSVAVIIKYSKVEQLEGGPMPNVMAAQLNIRGALCESSVIPFLVPCRKVWLTPAAQVRAVTLPI